MLNWRSSAAQIPTHKYTHAHIHTQSSIPLPPVPPPALHSHKSNSQRTSSLCKKVPRVVLVGRQQASALTSTRPRRVHLQKGPSSASSLVLRDVQLALGDEALDLRGGLAVDRAAERRSRAQDLLDRAGQRAGHGALAHDACHADDLVQRQVAVVLDVLDLLAVARGLLELLDQQRRGAGDQRDRGLAVDDRELDRHVQALPVLGGLADVLADLLGGQTERADLGGQRRSGGNLAAHRTQNDDLLFASRRWSAHGVYRGCGCGKNNDAPALSCANVGIAVAGATDAAKASASIVLLDEGIGTIATAIDESKKVFQRVEAYIAYRITATLEFLVFFVCSIAFLGFSLPAIALVLITLLNDFVVVSVSHDRTIADPHPKHWHVTRLVAFGVVVGLIAAGGVICIYFLFISLNPKTGLNYFGQPYDPMCFYTSGPVPTAFNATALLNYTTFPRAQCNPLCPGFDPSNGLDCPAGVNGPSQAMSVVFVILCLGGELKIFVVRTKRIFFTALPGLALFLASLFCWVMCAIIAGLVPYTWNLPGDLEITYPNGMAISVAVAFHHVDGLMLLYSYLICICLTCIEDIAKLLFNVLADRSALVTDMHTGSALPSHLAAAQPGEEQRSRARSTSASTLLRDSKFRDAIP